MANVSPEERFWSKVERGNAADCWTWQGKKNTRGGYGRAYYDGRDTGAHRVAWRITTGRWPALFILHNCDNPLCVNPAHLREGTCQENTADMVRRGRWVNQYSNGPVTHCVHGHEYTPDNTMLSVGKRYCRACYRAKDRRRAEARRAEQVSA